METFLAWLPWLVAGVLYLWWDARKDRREREERERRRDQGLPPRTRRRPPREEEPDTRFERGWGTQGWDE